MSYILDALKKIEHEKNKKRTDGRFNISGDLFQERKQPASNAGTWKIVTLIVLASLLACGGTWFALNGRSVRSVAVVRSPAPPLPTTIAPTEVTQPAQVPDPVPSQQIAPAVTQPIAAPIPNKNSAEAGDDESQQRSARKPAKQAKAKTKMIAVQTVAPPADIKLSGIAWQDERFARRAVINGFLLKEGAVVSGAKISEIQADRVLFVSTAGTFEIRLDAVLPAEVKR